MPKLKTMKIAGRDVDVHVSDSGEFYADVLGDRLKAPSLAALKNAAEKMLKRAGTLEVPATLISQDWGRNRPPTLEDVVLTGKHAGSGRTMYRDSDGAHQRGHNETFLRRLTAEERAALADAWQKQHDAREAYDQTISDLTMDDGEAIEQAAAVIEADAKKKGAANAV